MASTTSQSSPLTLTFPRSTFAKLSPAPYLQAHLTSSTKDSGGSSATSRLRRSRRPNGRSPNDFRDPPLINTSSLTHCQGSAVVRCGDTAAVCGVRAEVLEAKDVANYPGGEASDDVVKGGDGRRRRADEPEGLDDDDIDIKMLDLLVPNVELSTGCSPNHLPGNPPTSYAMSLAVRLREALYTSGLVGSRGLCIYEEDGAAEGVSAEDVDMKDESKTGAYGDEEAEEEEGTIQSTTPRRPLAFWTLYIDILFISLDGNAFDTAWLAMLAALRDVRLPHARWDADREMVLCSWGKPKGGARGGVFEDPPDDSSMRPGVPLDLHGTPVALTGAVFRAREHGLRSAGVGAEAETQGNGHAQIDDEQQGDQEGCIQRSGQRCWLLVDPDAFEEALCEEDVTVILDAEVDGEDDDMRIVSLRKNGGGVLGKRDVAGFIRTAAERARVVKQVVDAGKV